MKEIELDLLDPEAVIAAFEACAEASMNASHRRGGIAELGEAGRLVITGDLHDHGMNLKRACKLAALADDPGNYLILHELVHGRTG